MNYIRNTLSPLRDEFINNTDTMGWESQFALACLALTPIISTIFKTMVREQLVERIRNQYSPTQLAEVQASREYYLLDMNLMIHTLASMARVVIFVCMIAHHAIFLFIIPAVISLIECQMNWTEAFNWTIQYDNPNQQWQLTY